MSFKSLNMAPDGEKNPAYQHLQESTLPTPNWIDTEQNSSYEDTPIQLTFRHAESWQNTVDNDFNAQFQALKLEYWDPIPEVLLFPLITEYIIEKIQSGDDEEIDITEKWVEDCESVNTALMKSMGRSNREIQHVTISPKKRTRQTASEILKWIVPINQNVLERDGRMKASWVNISLNQNVTERDFGSHIGFYHWWARWYLQKPEQRERFQKWCSSAWKWYFWDVPNWVMKMFLKVISENRKAETRENVIQRVRWETQNLLDITDKNWVSLMVTHAWTIKALMLGVIDPEKKNEKLEWFMNSSEFSPKNTSMTVIGKSEEGGLLLMGYNLRPSRQ